MTPPAGIRWGVFAAVTIFGVVLLMGGLHRIEIETDILRAMPTGDPVLADAARVIARHPFQDQVIVDLGLDSSDPEILTSAASIVQDRMIGSGLFQKVGVEDERRRIPDLVNHLADRLPFLFSAEQLEREAAPLLDARHVQKALEDGLSRLQALEGIGRAAFFSRDPLGLLPLALKRLSHLAPSRNARIFQGHILSEDGTHLLIPAKPEGSGTDSIFAARAMTLFSDISRELAASFPDHPVVLTPVGAFRAALDNENIARKDVRRAIGFSTLGIAVLLIFAFPRPLMGLFSLLPALFGTAAAFFFYGLIHPGISVMALGFGGAIISITVDHGIAYMLFLDRPHDTRGRDAARDVRNIGLLAGLTTVVAFLALSVSGFPVLAQLGQFAALGIGFSFLFVHTLFPVLIPSMPAARRRGDLPIQRLANRLIPKPGSLIPYIAGAIGAGMLFYATPGFKVDLRAMNTVGEETRAAERKVASVWGDLLSKVFIMIEAPTYRELRQAETQLAGIVGEPADGAVFPSAFLPAMIFPDEASGRDHFQAWRAFWDREERGVRLKKTIHDASARLGFTQSAFTPFFDMMESETFSHREIPEAFFPVLGITRDSGENVWRQFAAWTPGPAYRAELFRRDLSGMAGIRVFDPVHFAETLGRVLSETFIRMTGIVGLSVVLLLVFFFRSPTLAAIALLPIAFALIMTLGTFGWTGRPLTIPALMIGVVVIGMGVDYSIFFIQSYRRYGGEHAAAGLIRVTVFMAAASTLIGFGVLCAARHALLADVGFSSLLGIGYAVIGAFVFLPPILSRLFPPLPIREKQDLPNEKDADS